MRKRGLFRYIWSRNALRVSIMWVVGGVITSMMLIPPIQIEVLTNLFQDAQPSKPVQVGDIVVPLLIIFCVELGIRACYMLDGVVRVKFQMDLYRTLIRDAYRRVLRMPFEFFSQHEVERINSRVLDDSEIVGAYVANALITVPMAVVALIYFGTYMLYQNWFLGICVLVSSFSSAYFLLLDGLIQRRSRQLAETWDTLRVLTSEVISNDQQIRVLGAFDWGNSRLDAAIDNFSAAAEKRGRLDNAMLTAGNFVRKLQVIIVYVVGSMLCVGVANFSGADLQLSWGEVIKFAMIAELFSQPVSQISKFFRSGRTSHQFTSRLGEFLMLPVAFQASGKAPPTDGTPMLEFQDVRLASAERRKSSESMSLSVEPGDWVAIVGPAAAGKSAFLRTALGETPPTTGTVCYRQTPLHEISFEALTQRLACVPQKPGFFDLSLRANILMDYPRPPWHDAQVGVATDDGAVADADADVDRELVNVIRQVDLQEFVLGRALQAIVLDEPEHAWLRAVIPDLRDTVKRKAEASCPGAVQHFRSDQLLRSATVGENIFGIGFEFNRSEKNVDRLRKCSELFGALLAAGTHLARQGTLSVARRDNALSLMLFLPTYRSYHYAEQADTALAAREAESEADLLLRVLNTHTETFLRICMLEDIEALLLEARKKMATDTSASCSWGAWQTGGCIAGVSLLDNLLGGRMHEETPDAVRKLHALIREEFAAAGLLGEALLLGLATRVGIEAAAIPCDERYKVALARGLIRNPEVLIVDEAFDGIAEDSRKRIFARLRNERPRLAVIFATRDAGLAEPGMRTMTVHGTPIDEPSKRGEPVPADAGLGLESLSDADGVSLLARCPLLAQLDHEELEACFLSGKVFRYRAQEALFSRGDPGGQMFVVFRGEVAITVAGGAEVALCTPGMAVGELTVLGQRVRSFSAVAKTDATVFSIDREQLITLLNARPQVAVKMLEATGNRCAEIRDEIHSRLS